ncbi:MAG: hypothetical protein IPG44_16940 [Anaerolineales bacterium]|nr:hypothetical protein [Anaerolineales bacterium]
MAVNSKLTIKEKRIKYNFSLLVLLIYNQDMFFNKRKNKPAPAAVIKADKKNWTGNDRRQK